MSQSEKRVITRFAPSPTGFLHIGGVRTALFNYLFTRKNSGTYFLRIDDTDSVRSKKEYEENIINGFRAVGLLWDNKTLIRQSERTDLYRKCLGKLLKEKKVFVSKETVLKEGDRPEVIRFKNPNKKITIEDMIRGEVVFDTTELGDFVVAKSLEEPIYHFASVVDDFEMGITHIIRAEEHLSNTPRQILIQEALGVSRPIYAHIPMILAPDRSKLSKRHGATALTDYLARGYLPEAIINYLALLGWNPGTDQEIFSLAELVENFDLSKVQKGGAIFNVEKLNWFNKQYMQKFSPEEKISRLKDFLSPEQIEIITINPKFADIMTERVSTFGELRDLVAQGEFDYFLGKPVYDRKILLWKGAPDFAKTKNRLVEAKKLLEAIPTASFNRVAIKEALWPFAEKEGRGEVLWPVRAALSGKEKSPDPFALGEMLGREETLARLTNAVNLLS